MCLGAGGALCVGLFADGVASVSEACPTVGRAALDWWKRFRDAAKPVFEQLYEEVATGREAQRSIDLNSKPDYRQKLEEELRELRESEMWQAGAVVRKLRPENN